MDRSPATTVLDVLSSLDTALKAAPWWCDFLLAMAVVVLAAIRMIFPQKSADRLEWWKDRRARSARTKPGQTPDARPRPARRRR